MVGSGLWFTWLFGTLCSPMAGTKFSESLTHPRAASAFAQEEGKRQDLKQAARLLGDATVRHRVLGEGIGGVEAAPA